MKIREESRGLFFITEDTKRQIRCDLSLFYAQNGLPVAVRR